jgi:large subunit ribosomal protein L15
VANTTKIGLHNLSPAPRSHRDRKRVGRGPGSGTGKTAGKGHKGSKARAGHGGPGGGKPHFEGGQMPLFTNPFRVEHQIVTVEALNRWPEGTEVTQEALVEKGWVKARKGPAKLLATGNLTRAVTVRGVKMSASARERILAAGGRVEA